MSRYSGSLAVILAGVALALLSTTALGQDAAASPPPPGAVGVPLALAPEGSLPIEGTPWRLRAYRYRGIERTPGPEVAASMRLSGGKLDASGGCTPFKGRYGMTGSAISFELRGLRANDCAEQTTLVQLAMVDGLRKAASYRIDRGEFGDEMTLSAANGVELLTFGLDDISELDQGEWRLESYTVDGVARVAVADQPAVLSFRAKQENEARRRSSGPATGSTGCNGFVAEHYRHANVMSFGGIERTDAPCTQELLAQEAAIISVLDATSQRLDLPADRLTLTSHDSADRLDYVSARPLEASTWLLSRLPGAAQVVGTATLRLSSGVAAGQGPCGPYAATYISDGLFITFGSIEGADDEACAFADAEKALLSAFRDSVRVEREPSGLRFEDAHGETVARFKAPSGP